MLLFSCANKNFLFWRLSNDCQIVRPALVSGPPNRKKPYNKHLISLVSSVRTVNYGSSFFSIDLCMASSANNRMEKNSVRNLQYGQKTRLIRGIFFSFTIRCYLNCGNTVSFACDWEWQQLGPVLADLHSWLGCQYLPQQMWWEKPYDYGHQKRPVRVRRIHRYSLV